MVKQDLINAEAERLAMDMHTHGGVGIAILTMIEDCYYRPALAEYAAELIKREQNEEEEEFIEDEDDVVEIIMTKMTKLFAKDYGKKR